MRLKKAVSLLMVCFLLFATGCSSGAAPEGGTDEDKPSYTLTFATSVSLESPETQGLIYLGEILEERSNGRIKGETFYGGTLGSEMEIVEQTQSGAIHAAVAAWATWANFAAQYTPWVVPYLYPDRASVQKSWEGKTGEAMREAFAENGLWVAPLIFRGNRQLTSNRLVETPDDLKGLKLRLPETPAWVTVWTELGTLPTTIAPAEVFSALQMGVVDAQENPIISNHQKGLQEVQKYTIMTNHIVDFLAYMVDLSFLNSLDADDRELVVTAFEDAATYTQKLYDKMEDESRVAMEQAGVEFIEVDTASFREKALNTLDLLKRDWADWVYDEALSDTSS